MLQVLANGDVNSSTLERMNQLVQECLSLSAGVAVANPRGSFTFHSLKMDAASPTAAVQAPGQDFWARIVVSVEAWIWLPSALHWRSMGDNTQVVSF